MYIIFIVILNSERNNKCIDFTMNCFFSLLPLGEVKILWFFTLKVISDCQLNVVDILKGQK